MKLQAIEKAVISFYVQVYRASYGYGKYNPVAQEAVYCKKHSTYVLSEWLYSHCFTAGGVGGS